MAQGTQIICDQTNTELLINADGSAKTRVSGSDGYDLKINADGSINTTGGGQSAVSIKVNTVKDGTGTEYYALCDSDGKLIISESAATSANQTTGNTALATIAGDTTKVAII